MTLNYENLKDWADREYQKSLDRMAEPDESLYEPEENETLDDMDDSDDVDNSLDTQKVDI